MACQKDVEKEADKILCPATFFLKEAEIFSEGA